ncbi:MAG: VirB3 family type IV secretion system protein [Vulcanimicrobiaceae bacterium]
MTNEPVQPGSWRAPLWLGCEPRLTILMIFVVLLAIMSHAPSYMIFVGIVVVGAWMLATRLAEHDPQQFSIMLETQFLVGKREPTRLSLLDERPLRLPKRNRI